MSARAACDQNCLSPFNPLKWEYYLTPFNYLNYLNYLNMPQFQRPKWIPRWLSLPFVIFVVFILMLLFFLLVYYVNPLYKMLDGLNNYRSFNRKYSYTFDGDDQLSELNDGITELVSENQQLRKRVTDMRNKMTSKNSNETQS